MGMMMGLVAVAIIIVGLVFLLPQLDDIACSINPTCTVKESTDSGIVGILVGDIFNDGHDEASDAEDKAKAETLGVTPTVGQQVCDLKVTVNGELDISTQNSRDILFPIPFTENNLHVWINDKIENTPPISHEWYNCFESDGSSLVTSSLLSLFQNNIQSLDWGGFALGDSFDIRLEGESQDGKILKDSSGNIKWSKHIQIDDGSAITIPYAFSHTFVLDNVPAENYNLKIFAEDKKLNGGITNSYVNYKVFAP